MSSETHLLRMDVANDLHADALKDLTATLLTYKMEFISRIPDQDDWDDTLGEIAGAFHEATHYINMARQKLKEGS